VVTRALTVWRSDPGSATGIAPDESLPRLSADDAARVADYLDSGAVVARTTSRRPDPWSGSDAAQVPLTQRTDGVWRWDDAVSYYVRRYGLSPGDEFLAYARDRRFDVPVLTRAQVSAVIDEVFGAPGESPSNHVRLDGSQLLSTESYCAYGGQNFRYTLIGAGDHQQVRLSVRPGEPVPDGFAQASGPAQETAFKAVSPAEIDGFFRVLTSCSYKGSAASIRRIDGSRLVLHLGGGRRVDVTAPKPPQPTFHEWGLFANAEILGQGDIWVDIDIAEAARVTMAVVPCHLVSGRVVPVRDVTGYGYAVPTPEEIFYFRSPAESPYLPPADAVAAVGAADPSYVAGAPERLRDGWRVPTSGAADVYFVADDGVIVAAPADMAVELVSSRLSAEFRIRHPFVDPPPADDSGDDIFD
jgi:hypothetical protein